MRNQRKFSLEFKRQVVKVLLSSAANTIFSSLLYHWKDMYSRGRFNNEPTEVSALKDKVEKLERLVGKLTLENEVLKKAFQNSLSRSQRNGKSSGYGDASVLPSGGGAK